MTEAPVIEVPVVEVRGLHAYYGASHIPSVLKNSAFFR
jgi:hypothetical protein